MLKKSMATALLVLTIPTLASASWFLTTQVMNAGGSLESSNQKGQIVTDPAITKSYNTITAQNPTAHPAAGNSVRSLVVTDSYDGTNTVLPAGGFTPADGHTYSVAATFQVQGVSVTAGYAAGSKGTVSPSNVGGVYYGQKLINPLTFTFAPATGGVITAIGGVPGADANGKAPVTVLPANDATGINKRATVTFPAGYQFTTAIALAATVDMNKALYLGAIAPVTAAPGAAVTLAVPANNISGGSWVWSYVSGPANTTTYTTTTDSKGNPGKVVATMTPKPDVTLTVNGDNATLVAPATTGQYKFTLTNGTYKTVAVLNVLPASQAGVSQCQFCHSANKIATVADTSTHATCQSCHYGGTGHPGSVNAGTVDAATFVVKMDNVSNGNGTTAAQGTNFCASCHGQAGNAAQPIPVLSTHQNKDCSDCHTSAHQTHVASANCQVCHATVNDHTPASMGNKECIDCHNGHNPTMGTQPLIGAASNHPPVTLYTFEEVGMQMANGQPVPVQVGPDGKGMPYSPKMTCGTSGCHVINGVNYTYDKITDHAFHSAQGRNEYIDSDNGKFNAAFNKPFQQSGAMVGKW